MSGGAMIPGVAFFAVILRGILAHAFKAAPRDDEPAMRPMVVTGPPLLKTPPRAAPSPAEPPVETATGWIRLGVDDGVESWLQFETGAIVTRPATGKAQSPLAPNAPPSPMMTAVRAAFDERNIHYLPTSATSIALFWREAHGRYVVVLTVDDATRQLHAWTVFGAVVPEEARPAVRELIERINPRIEAGALELDEEDGDVYVRIRIAPSAAELTPAIARQAVFSVLAEAENYHRIIMRVAFGGTTVEQAIVEGELW